MRVILRGLVLVVALVGACGPVQSVRSVTEPLPDSRPENFTLAVTVLPPARAIRPVVKTAVADQEEKVSGAAEEPVVSLPRSLRPGRYIVEPSGALRASLGAGAAVNTYPPQTRQLSPREEDLLWRLVRDSGLLEATNPGRIDGPEQAVRSPDRTTALFFIGYGERRAMLRVLLDRGTEDSVSAERVVDRLAELAWVR